MLTFTSEFSVKKFYRGAIAGLFTRFFGRDVKVQETECIAKGDPYYKFTILNVIYGQNS
jgi:predicted hydrocarbon binding protein